jgi:hypothetical protein
MLLRTFSRPADTADDIANIPERRRVAVIYRYPDSPHRTMFELYKGNYYDLYLINTSTLVGKDYIVPKGMVVQFKNAYRGKVINPFNIDGSLNYNAPCIFNNVNFASRIVNGREVLRYNKKEMVNSGSYEQHVARMLRSDLICPLPHRYNFEDQALLEKGKYREMDFDLSVNNVPHYTLGNLRDSKTSYVTVDIHDDNLFQNEMNLSRIIFPGDLAKDEETQWLLNLIKDEFTMSFLECYDIVMKSVFARAYIIFDIESGLFSVAPNFLTLKYSYNISKDEINNEYALLISDIAPVSDNLSEVFTVDHLNYLEHIPSRVTYYISPAYNKIRFSNPEAKENYLNIDPAMGSSEYSSSDADESSLARESTYLSDYYGYDGDEEG